MLFASLVSASVLISALGPQDRPPAPGPGPATDWTPEQTDCGRQYQEAGLPLPSWMLEGIPAARESMWDRRRALPAMCLFNASKLWIGIDNGRSADLNALARVRVRYDAMRCREFETNPRPNRYVSLAQTRELESSTWLRAVPEGQGDGFRARLSAAALDPRTYDYAIDLDPICADRGGARPEADWPDVRARLQQAFAVAR